MAAVPVFHIKHCWVFVLVIFFVQRSHFYPLGRGGDYVVLPGLLNPLARPETQRWDRLPLYSVPWRGWGCSHQPWLLDSDPPNGNTAEPASVPSCCLCKATVGACVCGAVSHQLQSRPMSVSHCWQTRDALAPGQAHEHGSPTCSCCHTHSVRHALNQLKQSLV